MCVWGGGECGVVSFGGRCVWVCIGYCEAEGSLPHRHAFRESAGIGHLLPSLKATDRMSHASTAAAAACYVCV